ncbi:MAG: adenosylcobinamide-GDP ribazoletransferase [Kineosporiaceae bacterium]
MSTARDASRGGPGGSRVWTDAVRLATGTLTTVRVRPPGRIDRARAGRAMLLAPAVGLVPAGAGALAGGIAGQLGASTTVCAVLAVAGAAWLSRGLHLDGLADTADGLAAAYDRDRALEVMRRGDTGPAGVVTLVLVVALQVAALTQAWGRYGATAALVVLSLGRLALPWACRRGVAAARPDGLGATVAGSVPVPAALAVTVLAWLAAVVGLAAGAAHSGVTDVVDAAVPAAAAVTAAVLACVILVRRCRSRLGGITGDVLGATVELSSAACAFALVLAG